MTKPNAKNERIKRDYVLYRRRQSAGIRPLWIGC